jgi:hypothetical protein
MQVPIDLFQLINGVDKTLPISEQGIAGTLPHLNCAGGSQLGDVNKLSSLVAYRYGSDLIAFDYS